MSLNSQPKKTPKEQIDLSGHLTGCNGLQDVLVIYCQCV